MKRFSKTIISLAFLGMLFSIASCGSSETPMSDFERKTRDIYESGLRDGSIKEQTYEEWLNSIMGQDGHTPVVNIGSNGNWFIDGVDTGISARGPQGETGPQGEPGKDGTSVITGSGEPTSATGENGDSYINLDNWDFYIKVNNAWVKQGNIKGSQGEQGIQGVPGQDGTSMLNGSGVPSTELGKEGDSYIDLETWNYYVKEDKKWVLKGNIKGEDLTDDNPQQLDFYLTDNNTYYVGKGNSSLLSNVVIPSSYNGLPVTGIIKMGFDSNIYKSMTKTIYIPDTVTSIGEQAFQYCSSLTFINIPDSVTSIGSYAFYNCTSLTSITIPDSVSQMGGSVFSGDNIIIYCKNSYKPEEWPTNWNSGCAVIWGCDGTIHSTDEYEYVVASGKAIITSIKYDSASISIPEIIDGYAVSQFNLSSLTFLNAYKEKTLISFDIPDSVEGIGQLPTFESFEHLNSFKIPNGVTSIGDLTFSNCSSLTSITIPDTVTSIGRQPFQYCSSLTSIIIPDSVTSIGSYAFQYCSSLTSIIIPDSVTSIGSSAFQYCSSLTSIIIPDSVTLISSYAFQYCSSLTSIIIPDSVTSIGYHAFEGCSSKMICYYAGNSDEWNTISKSDNYIYIYKIYFYSETEPTEEGNYWHYVDGVPAVWEI